MTGSISYTNSTYAEDHDNHAGLTDSGRTALWIGFGAQFIPTLYFIKACYRSRSSESRIFHYITTMVTMFASLTYLTLAIAESPGRPFGETTMVGGWNWLHYADWVFATPLLLIDLGMLAHMEKPELLFICTCDVLMIISGFAGFISNDPRAVWPLFAFSMFMFFIIIGNLLVHLQALIKLHSEGAENKTFVFLAAWTIGLWNVFPIIFVLEKQYVLNHDQGQIIQVTLDILAKVVFGIVLMGYRELMEGHHSGLVTFTIGMVGIDPHEVDAIRAKVEAEAANNPVSRSDYFEHIMAMHSPKPVNAGDRARGGSVSYDQISAMAKQMKDLEAQVAAANANAAAASSSSEGSYNNPLNAGSRRNSLTTGPGAASARRPSGTTANLPRSDTAVLTQIAIAMQNDPALAGQLRSIVSPDAGAAQAV